MRAWVSYTRSGSVDARAPAHLMCCTVMSWRRLLNCSDAHAYSAARPSKLLPPLPLPPPPPLPLPLLLPFLAVPLLEGCWLRGLASLSLSNSSSSPLRHFAYFGSFFWFIH